MRKVAKKTVVSERQKEDDGERAFQEMKAMKTKKKAKKKK